MGQPIQSRDDDESKALFRQLIEDARGGDEESRAVLAERADQYDGQPEWAELVALARDVLARPGRPKREWRRQWEPEGLAAGTRRRTLAALFVIALVIGAAVILSG